MLRILLALGLLVQGIPTRPDQTGVVTGTLRTTDGKPAIGIRVAARAAGDTTAEAAEGAALAGLAETDEMGRYRLEGVPNGRYTITAGRVDLPTYYPGTLDLAGGKVLTITPGSLTTGIDFTLADLSYAIAGVSSQPPGVFIPVKLTLEGNGKIPVFANGDYVQLVLRPEDGGGPTIAAGLGTSSITLPFPSTPRAFRTTIDNLPPGYRLKAMTYGSANLMTQALPLSAADLPLAAGAAATQARMALRGVGPVTQLFAIGIPAQASARLATELAITLVSSTPVRPSDGGVRVSGRLPVAGDRSIYISDIPGTLYSDGTFEFLGVKPGRHLIVSGNNQARPFGAVVVVGDRDLEGVELDTLVLLPLQAPPVAADSHPPGTVIPLAGLRGQVVSDATGQPLRGSVNVIGDSLQATYALGDDGRFQIPKLLPGRYNLQVSIFDHYTLNQAVVVGETDMSVELRIKRVY